MREITAVIFVMLLRLNSGAVVTTVKQPLPTSSTPQDVFSQLAALSLQLQSLENQTNSCSQQIAAFQSALASILASINCEFTIIYSRYIFCR
jgi:hypothetical protein